MPEDKKMYEPCDNKPCPNQENVPDDQKLYVPNCPNTPCKGYENLPLEK